MKKIMAVLLSFQLIISPLAIAKEVQGSGKADSEDAYLKTGTGSSGGYDFYASQILTLATSAIGASIITQCLEGMKTPSIALFMGGSLTHIMSEILGAKAKTDRYKKKRKDLEINESKLVKEGDSSQKMALEAQYEEEKDTRDFLKNRKKWLIAVTTIYTAAMGFAIAEEVYGLASGSSTAAAACSGYAASCTVGAALCASHCTAGILAGIAESKALWAMPEARATLTSFCASFTPALAGCMAFVQFYLNLVYGSCLMLPKDGGVLSLSWGTALAIAYGFGTAKLNSGSKVTQYGSMLITLMNLMVPSLSKLVVGMYNFPIPRSITFGAAAVFSGTVTAGLASRQTIAESNLEKLDKVLKDFTITSAADDAKIEFDDKADSADLPMGDKEVLKFLPKNGEVDKLAISAKQPKDCFTKGSEGVELSAQGCRNPIKMSKPNFGQFNLPTLSKVGNLTTQMVDALGAGDEMKAGEISSEIGTYAARVNKEVEALQAMYNDQQKKNKKPTIDFKKSVKDQVAAMKSSLSQNAASNNIDLAAAAGSSSSVADSKSEATTPQTNAVSTPTTGFPIDSFGGLSSGGPEPVADLASQTIDSVDNYEIDNQDISKKADVPIFQQLSNRYFLNFNKIFERKKVQEVEEAPKK
jgi:hypothetical protein